jgi:NAD(P)-dependent dehydrogenase (short-subunit alcohol dehydrogenase family)
LTQKLDNKNKTVVITGATSGIGLAVAKQLAKTGMNVITTGRTQSRCDEAQQVIKDYYPHAIVSFVTVDFSSLNQVREAANKIREILYENDIMKLDVLINNAGTVSSWYVNTEDGFELQFAVNHLAHFLLTHELIKHIYAAPEGRIITVSSGSHRRTRINWNDVMNTKHYNLLKAYKLTKLANVLFTFELSRMLPSDRKVSVFAADPGLVNTCIGLKGTHGIERWVWEKRSKRGVPPEKAASSIVYLATEPGLNSTMGLYWKDCKSVAPSRYSQRRDVAKRLWELSERMCAINSEDYGLNRA